MYRNMAGDYLFLPPTNRLHSLPDFNITHNINYLHELIYIQYIIHTSHLCTYHIQWDESWQKLCLQEIAIIAKEKPVTNIHGSKTSSLLHDADSFTTDMLWKTWNLDDCANLRLVTILTLRPKISRVHVLSLLLVTNTHETVSQVVIFSVITDKFVHATDGKIHHTPRMFIKSMNGED